MSIATIFALIVTLLVIASFAAFAIGANDNTMASIVGAKVLRAKSAIILGGTLFIIGAVVLGQGVSSTLGANMVTAHLPIEFVLITYLAIIIWMLLSSYQGYPISATHAAVGSIVGVGMIYQLVWGLPILRWDTIIMIVIGWIVSPILSLVIAFLLHRVVGKQVRMRSTQLDEVERIESRFGWLLLVMVIIICLSRGGNDVAKAIGLLTIIFVDPIQLTLLLLLGGVGMAIGLMLIGKRVVKTVGIELTELRPSTSFSAATASAIVLLIGTILAIPLAATHILISSVIGVGIANQTSINKSVLRKLILTAILTVPITIGLVICIWGIYQIAYPLIAILFPF